MNIGGHIGFFLLRTRLNRRYKLVKNKRIVWCWPPFPAKQNVTCGDVIAETYPPSTQRNTQRRLRPVKTAKPAKISKNQQNQQTASTANKPLPVYQPVYCQVTSLQPGNQSTSPPARQPVYQPTSQVTSLPAYQPGNQSTAY